MEEFASRMGWVAARASFIVGVLAFVGVLPVTGAPPGGVLAHLGIIGGAVAVVANLLWGAVAPILLALTWFSLLALPMAVLGTVRRRARWYAVPVAVVFPLVGEFGRVLGEGAQFWLGGVSRLDVAAFWMMFTAMGLTAVGQFPIWVRNFWEWTNGSKCTTDESASREPGVQVDSESGGPADLPTRTERQREVPPAMQRSILLLVLLSAALSGGVAYAVAWWFSNSTMPLVRAEAFQLVDKEGNTRAALTTRGDSSTLALHNKQGQVQASVTVEPGGASGLSLSLRALVPS